MVIYAYKLRVQGSQVAGLDDASRDHFCRIVCPLQEHDQGVEAVPLPWRREKLSELENCIETCTLSVQSLSRQKKYAPRKLKSQEKGT